MLQPPARRVLPAEVAGAPNWRAVCEMPGGQPADMAIQSGRAAIDAAQIDNGDVDWVLHCGSGPQASVGWPVHHHVREGIVGDHGDAMEIRQYCAAGLTDWLLAARLVRDDRAVVCTGADNWSWGDRFLNTRTQGGRPFADVAHAAVVHAREGFARFCGSGTASQVGQADLWRTRTAFWEATGEADFARAYDRVFEARTRESDHGYVEMLARAVDSALTSAGMSPQYVTRFVPPMSGGGEPFRMLAKAMDLPWSEELYQRGLDRGYLGVSSQAAGLVDLAETNDLATDSIVLLLSAEYQVSATAAVLEIVRPPVVSAAGDVRVAA